MTARTGGEGKPRPLGKGKLPRAESAPRITTSASRPSNKRNLTVTPGNRVTSIARHFDRLSREAERERQKRISMVRNKRARPVAATKVKEQVFDNVRDAFRDEFDTDSSEADNEEDEHGSEDSADSGGMAPTNKKRRSRSPSKSPRKSPKVDLAPIDTSEVTLALPVPVAVPVSADDPVEPSSEAMSISGSGQSIASTSATSDAKSEMSFTDRLQIDLPTFETSAPLPSVPATPVLSAETADEGGMPSISHVSQLSESEMSSGGERSSILKTLTGLWAFRAGDYTPLEYPLSAAEHIFADSRVIIRENEPTSIIAFTLTSKTYREKMRDFLAAKQKGKKEAFMPEDASGGTADRSSMWDIVSLDEAVEPDDSSRREGGTHLKYGELSSLASM
jgi:1-phosphatidylinositol-3-phosphate 5-kinase